MVTTWKRTVQTLNEVEDQLDDDDEVPALGATGQDDDCWLVGKDGDPIHPTILWSDGRTNSVVQA